MVDPPHSCIKYKYIIILLSPYTAVFSIFLRVKRVIYYDPIHYYYGLIMINNIICMCSKPYTWGRDNGQRS